ncbi:MAG: peptide deformylase [Verrucomicrobia bacterium]|jgi:peptide deformylase|nr:peptide deformylase [Verrucomicrobiota bacterium]
MILPVVKYGHPVLRQKGARIESVNASIKKLIADMLETMYAAKGVGLAAQQVGQALQLTVIDVRGVTDRPSTLEQEGKPDDVHGFMPLVLINPEVKPTGETVAGGEGCLSFPEVFAEIARPEFADVQALDQKGKPITFRGGGLLARVVQHEADHLNGILFIDRMASDTKRELKPQLEELQAATKVELQQAKKK